VIVIIVDLVYEWHRFWLPWISSSNNGMSSIRSIQLGDKYRNSFRRTMEICCLWTMEIVVFQLPKKQNFQFLEKIYYIFEIYYRSLYRFVLHNLHLPTKISRQWVFLSLRGVPSPISRSCQGCATIDLCTEQNIINVTRGPTYN